MNKINKDVFETSLFRSRTYMWQQCFEVCWSKCRDYLYLYIWHACKLCGAFSNGYTSFLAKRLKFTL